MTYGEEQEAASAAMLTLLTTPAADPASGTLVLGLRRQVPDDDRAARTTRSELGDRHVFVDGVVVVEIETDLVTVELDGAVEVTDGNDDYFEGPVHETAFR